MKLFRRFPLPRPLLHKYHALSQRDRRALQLLATFLAVVTIWNVVWLPLENARLHYSEEYRSAMTDYAWMNAQTPLFKSNQSLSAPALRTDAGSVMSTVTSSAVPFQIIISRAEPTQDNKLLVTISSAPFNQLLSWLDQLQSAHRISPANMIIEKIPETSGQVSVQLSFALY